MLRPSYSELMETLNNAKKVDSQITSRYTIVLAVAKRARQIIDGANPLTYAPTDRAVSIAVKELDEGKLLIKVDPEQIENTLERPGVNHFYSAVTKDDLREDLKEHYEPDDALDDDDYKDDDFKDTDEESDEDYKDDDFINEEYEEAEEEPFEYLDDEFPDE
jgi:DNA-directed RNA polymerase subunit omega